MESYRKGRRIEEQLRHTLQEKGLLAVRSSRSQFPDLVVISHKRVLLLEVTLTRRRPSLASFVLHDLPRTTYVGRAFRPKKSRRWSLELGRLKEKQFQTTLKRHNLTFAQLVQELIHFCSK